MYVNFLLKPLVPYHPPPEFDAEDEVPECCLCLAIILAHNAVTLLQSRYDGALGLPAVHKERNIFAIVGYYS